MYIFLLILINFSVYTTVVGAFGEFVIITNNGPVVQGAEINFTAKVYSSSGQPASGHFQYAWDDNGIPYHSRTVKSDEPFDTWMVSYPAEHYPPGPYTMQVEVYLCLIFCFPMTSNRIHFNITGKLNGHMDLVQHGVSRSSNFISNETTLHDIILREPDFNYIQNASKLIYWFIDCQYYGMTSTLNFTYKYTTVEKQYVVEALVVAQVIETNTTNTTTTVGENALSLYDLNGAELSLDNSSNPLVCLNQTNIAPDPAKTYGYFYRAVIVKAPVDNITVNGNNWLQHGEMMSLDIKCNGSPGFKYCVNFLFGIHNKTGNETCLFPPEDKDVCEFNIARYYKSPGEYTVLIIVENDVSKFVYPVGINVYKVTKRPQVSVIVVPVSFSLVAVVLIVFGMAYYIQNQRRFTVEVANFDFGQSYTDMEYKTFRERLRDSLTNALTRTPQQDQSETPPPNWPTSTTTSRKYGSMT